MSSHVIDGYELLDELGSGSTGTVYSARHLETGESVAIKLLNDQAAKETEVQQRFVREVSVLERLRHPNIVEHRGCGIHEGRLYFAMELLNSGTVKRALKVRGVLRWRQATKVAAQVCAALAYAHKEQVIHRDLKPANLFLSAEGKVKVGDFGLARDNSSHRLTIEGQTVGTCRYMAPEQVRGEQELTGAVDLYALGCLLYQMLTGEPPFDGSTVIEIFEHHLFTDPPSVADHESIQCPAELSKLIAVLLTKPVDLRPNDAYAIRRRLIQILRANPEPKKEATH